MKSISIKLPGKTAYAAGILSLVILFSLSAGSQRLQAQTPYRITDGSQIKVSGTSNLHDWTMLATVFSSEGNFILKGDQLVDITALNVTIPVKNLKSKESLMDSRAYKALKAEQFGNITFKLTGATVNAQQKLIKASGNLTISGVTNSINLQANYVLTGNEITCKVSQVVKMSDYKMKAPSFMLGALKTGDELKIDIILKMKP